MGSQTSWYTILLIFSYLYVALGQSNSNLSRDSLDTLLQQYAFKSLIHGSKTGHLYKTSLPSEFLGMNVSVVRLRSGKFWSRGAIFNEFSMPHRILPTPFIERLAIVYQNLGNWSDTYYNVPGYSMVSPVVGFMTYNASNINPTKLNLSVRETPISVHFPTVLLPGGLNSTSNATLQCVRFGENGTWVFSQLASNNTCYTTYQGHFAVIVPSAKTVEKERKERLWKWLVIGFALGFAALVIIGLIGLVVFKFVRAKKLGRMEKRADEGESFETVWIGMSKMPSAAVMRTQPVLELEEIP